MTTTVARPRSRAAEIADRIAVARSRWPLDSHVIHTATGLRGVITLDHPGRVPCGTTGLDADAAWCVIPSATTTRVESRRPGWGVAVHVTFADQGHVWTAWIRSDFLRRDRREGRR
jgi:hypothetical protein